MATGDAEATARAAAERGGDLLAALADRVGARASAAAVFGEPVERDGITVIPVARAIWGFGGGSGTEPDREGSGGGGGGSVAPIGYIEIHGDRAEFRPLRDPRKALLGAGIVAGALALAIRFRR